MDIVSKIRTAAFAAAMLAMVMVMAGCVKHRDNCRLEGNVQVIGDTSIRMKYDLFDGQHVYTIDVPEQTAMRVEVETVSGELDAQIGIDGMEPVYTGRFTENASFTVNVSAGEYTIRLSASHHTGSCRFDWTANES